MQRCIHDETPVTRRAIDQASFHTATFTKLHFAKHTEWPPCCTAGHLFRSNWGHMCLAFTGITFSQYFGPYQCSRILTTHNDLIPCGLGAICYLNMLYYYSLGIWHAGFARPDLTSSWLSTACCNSTYTSNIFKVITDPPLSQSCKSGRSN